VRRIKLKSDLAYEKKPIYVMDTQERVTQSRVVKLHKVVWSNHGERDATWEREDYLRDNFFAFYENWYISKSRDKIFIRWEGYNTLGLWLAFIMCIT
jgi:hypothetical protein